MTWSLQLQHGDLAVSGTQLATAVDEQKLVQDLRCWLLESMGTDDMHPDFGSLLDGGVDTAGTVHPGVVGMDSQSAAQLVYSELQRLAKAYQAEQLSRAKDDRTTYGRPTLSPGEVLLSMSNIDVVQHEDSLTVHVTLETARGESIDLAIPIAST